MVKGVSGFGGGRAAIIAVLGVTAAFEARFGIALKVGLGCDSSLLRLKPILDCSLTIRPKKRSYRRF